MVGAWSSRLRKISSFSKFIIVSQPTTSFLLFFLLMLLHLSLASSSDIFSDLIFFLISFFLIVSSLQVGLATLNLSLLFFKILYLDLLELAKIKLLLKNMLINFTFIKVIRQYVFLQCFCFFYIHILKIILPCLSFY